MWPVIMNVARAYAPQIVLPAAMVCGFIGENFLLGRFWERGNNEGMKSRRLKSMWNQTDGSETKLLGYQTEGIRSYNIHNNTPFVRI